MRFTCVRGFFDPIGKSSSSDEQLHTQPNSSRARPHSADNLPQLLQKTLRQTNMKSQTFWIQGHLKLECRGKVISVTQLKLWNSCIISHKHSLPKKLAVHRMLYPSMLTEGWVEGKSVQGKRCTTNRENRSLMRIIKQNRFKNLGELYKEWTEAGVKESRATTHRRVKEFGYSCGQRCLTWAKEKNWTVAQWSKVLFQMRASFVFNLENKVLESGGRGVEKLIAQVAWSPVLSFHNLWWFGVQCHLLVLVHCFFENQSHCTRLPNIFVLALHASFCWPAF